MSEEELIEQLADREHASWAHWMHYLFSMCIHHPDGRLTIPGHLVVQWERQANTPYERLSEQEKQSDRDEVAHIMPIIGEYMQQAVVAISNAQMKQGVRLHPDAMLRAIEEAK